MYLELTIKVILIIHPTIIYYYYTYEKFIIYFNSWSLFMQSY